MSRKIDTHKLSKNNNLEFKIKVLGGFDGSGFYVSSPMSRVSDIYNKIISRNSKSKSSCNASI